MDLILSSGASGLETLRFNSDRMVELKIDLLVLLSFCIVVGILNIAYYLLSRNSPDFSIKSLLPVLSFKKPNLIIEADDDLGRPLTYTRLTIFKNERVYNEFSTFRSTFKVRLPKGEYKATLSKFGYVANSTKKFLIDDKAVQFQIELKRTEEVAEAFRLANFAFALLAIHLALFVAASILLILSYFKLTLSFQLILWPMIAFSALGAYEYLKLSNFISAKNFKGKPLADEKIEIFGKNHNPLKEVKTDNRGKLKLALSPGIYKFQPEKHSMRTVRILDRGLGHFKIKF